MTEKEFNTRLGEKVLMIVGGCMKTNVMTTLITELPAEKVGKLTFDEMSKLTDELLIDNPSGKIELIKSIINVRESE